MTFDKHINKVRTEMVNENLFATVKSFRFLSKGFVGFSVIPAV